MFESLSDRLSGVFDKLTRKGALRESDVTEALREVRVALLEADVALPVARDFVARVKESAIGQQVTKSVTPGQQVVKIVNDELVATLSGGIDPAEAAKDALLRVASPPSPILMVGLQGSGKTTTTAKIALRLTQREKKRVLMASLDTRRPAAMEQLAVLGMQIGVDTLPIQSGQTAVQIANRAMTQSRLAGYDVVMLDTAGRLHVDDELMAEVEAVRDVAQPSETLLVVDSLTGQDAVNVAENFDGRVGISGVVLTRMDGDGRGGAALSMRAVTGKPIKLVGVGEKMDALEEFVPDRVAGRILGMGDIVGLVEKAQEQVEADEAEKMMRRMQKGRFDFNDLKSQFEQMQKMGGLGGLMSMLPGVGKMQKQMDASGMDDSVIKRQIAIINSMTKEERKKPDVLAASRKKRIAKGAGVEVSEINKLMKMHRQMADMIKKLGKKGGRGAMQQMAAMMGMKGGMPPGMPPGGMPPGVMPPGAGLPPGAAMPPGVSPPAGLGGLGGMKLPSGLSGFGKKK